ncbi:MAG: hypothetical protein GY754_14340 [bacterium]|nr:hypothetical protein [bacterium]
MQRKQFIPKKIFQVFALATVAYVFGVAAYWTVTGTGLFGYFSGLFSGINEDFRSVFAFLLAFFIPFVLWVSITLFIRQFAKMPTPGEELKAIGKGNFKKVLVAAAREGYASGKESDKNGLMAGVGGLVLGAICGITTAILLVLTDELYLGLLIYATAFVVLGIGLGLRGLFSKKSAKNSGDNKLE